MWNNYPGQQQQQHHHQHHQQRGPQGGPPPPPGGFGFPSPEPGFNSPGYAPSYGPPPGGPPSGYGPPPGPPPVSRNSYPAQGGGGGGGGGYGGYDQGGYGPPSGPPPMPHHGSRPSGYGGGGGGQSGYGGGDGGYGGYAPPSGPPPQRPPTNQQNYGPQFENQYSHQQEQPYFQYSQCNGKKKALCIGINYFGTSAELKGCINDARNIKRFLCAQFGYKEDDIVMLTDDQNDPRAIPTKENIYRAMQWLVNGAQPNDSLFFHYSGHGGQTKDLDGDEADGYDEVIYPVDFKENGHIVDDEMHDIMVRPLPAGCRLTAIYDSCHSGSALDLPYIYSTEGKIKEPNLAAEAGQGLLTAVTSYARGDMGGVFSSLTKIAKTATGGGGKKAEERSRRTKTSSADCISWSGCKDSQTSADANEAGSATGAMSYAFITALSANPQQSYMQLLQGLRQILKAKYSQKPQLSSSHPMDTNLLFIC